MNGESEPPKEGARRPVGASDVFKAAGDELPMWLRRMVTLLDDAVTIPGTNQGVGLDALVGALFPGAGDTLSGMVSVVLLVVAVRRGVPPAILVRMLLQQLLDVLVGSVPVVGDVFDVFYRANRKNLELIEQYGDGKAEPSTADRVLAYVVVAAAIGLVLLPFALAFAFASFVLHRLASG